MQTFDLNSLQTWLREKHTADNKSAFLDNDFAVFDDIQQIHLCTYPNRLNMTIFAICLTGSIRIGVNLQEYDVTANGYVVLLPTQTVQLLKQSEDFSGIFVCVSSSMSDDILRRLQDVLALFFYLKEHPCTQLEAAELEWIKSYHSFLFKEMTSQGNMFRKEIAYGLLTVLFYETCNIFGRVLIRNKHQHTRQEELFEQFMHLLAEHYKDSRTIRFYADKLCITPKYLSSVVKNVSNKPAGEWIDNYVILEAKVLLKTTTQSVQQIADELNFANQSFFGKFFKQHTGISPYAYRKQG